MAPKSSTSPELPPEIIRHVLRFFSHDREALRNCALVSQDWLFESRSFLFRNIDIVYWGPYDHFVSNFLRSHRLRPWLTSIHHLSFGFMPSTTRQETFISDISERLSNLQTMKWAYFPPDLEDDRHLRPEVFPALGKFARLHHLELNDCDFASFEDLKKVIAALPSLSSLTLYRVQWDKSANANRSSSTLPSAQLWPATLSKLAFVTFYPHVSTFVDDVLLWLCASPSRHLLQELSFDLCNTAAALRLTLACTSLTTLHIRMYENHELLGKVPSTLPQAQRAHPSMAISHTHTFARSQTTTLMLHTWSTSSHASATSSSSASRSSQSLSPGTPSPSFSSYFAPPPRSAASASAARSETPWPPSCRPTYSTTSLTPPRPRARRRPFWQRRTRGPKPTARVRRPAPSARARCSLRGTMTALKTQR